MAPIKYISDLPYKVVSELCNILDYNNDWKNLAAACKNYDCYNIFQMELAIQRRCSPTDELLSRMRSENCTVIELFKKLHSIKHYRAMLVLKPYVDPKYHHLIPDGSTCGNGTSSGPPQDESRVFSAENVEIAQPNVKVNVHPEAAVQEENIPRSNHNAPTRKVSDPLPDGNVIGGTPHIPYQELTDATNNWDKLNILGRGGFGTVYKGSWKQMDIAVKKLDVVKNNKKSEETMSQCQREQSLRELKYLNSCRHDNILPLYGVSFESGKYCLIYQYQKNGSLEDRLSMRRNTPVLMWGQRLRIAVGAARGIQFLHAHNPPLIHGDIKSANILLNVHMEPVIGDFGLAQEGPVETATHITLKRVNGTVAYLPHDFLGSKKLTTKVDVYSFGIVLYEMATGLRAQDPTTRINIRMVIEKHSDNLHDLLDKNAQPLEPNIAHTFIKTGKVSTKLNYNERPEMVEVYKMLSAGEAESSIATRASINPIKAPPLVRPTPPIPPNNVAGHKFMKPPDSELPYLPPPIQLLQTNHPPQQTNPPINENPKPPHLHVSPTGSVMVGQPMMQPQPSFARHPNEMFAPNALKPAEPSTSHQQPHYAGTLPGPTALRNAENVIPEVSDSQDKSHECSQSCNHSSSEIDTTSVEIIEDLAPTAPPVFQNSASVLDIVALPSFLHQNLKMKK